MDVVTESSPFRYVESNYSAAQDIFFVYCGISDGHILPKNLAFHRLPAKTIVSSNIGPKPPGGTKYIIRGQIRTQHAGKLPF